MSLRHGTRAPEPIADRSRDRRLRVAALPLVIVALAVSLVSALSGGPLDALAGLPMLVLALALVGGRRVGIDVLVDWVESRRRLPRPAAAPRPRFGLDRGHSRLLRLLVGGRPLRGPPAHLCALPA